MKKVLLFITLLIGAVSFGQTIMVNGSPMLVDDQTSFPFWLESGSSISPETSVSAISVLEFNVKSNDDGNDMIFNQVLSLTSESSVPEGKVWKVESVLKLDEDYVFVNDSSEFSEGSNSTSGTSYTSNVLPSNSTQASFEDLNNEFDFIKFPLPQQLTTKVTESDSDGNIYIAGSYYTYYSHTIGDFQFPTDYPLGSYRIFLIKYNSLGEPISVFTSTETFSSQINIEDININDNGNIGLVWYLSNSNGIYVLDSSLNVIVNNDNSFDGRYHSIELDSENNFYVLGDYRYDLQFVGSNTITAQNNNSGGPSYDLFISKFSSQGTNLWLKSVSNSKDVNPMGITVDNENCNVIYRYYDDNSKHQIHLRKYSLSGGDVQMTFSSSSSESVDARDIVTSNQSTFILSEMKQNCFFGNGQFDGSILNYDEGVIIKVDNNSVDFMKGFGADLSDQYDNFYVNEAGEILVSTASTNFIDYTNEIMHNNSGGNIGIIIKLDQNGNYVKYYKIKSTNNLSNNSKPPKISKGINCTYAIYPEFYGSFINYGEVVQVGYNEGLILKLND